MDFTRGLPAALILLSIACTADEPAPPPLTETVAALQAPGPVIELTRSQLNGKQLFETVCWTCHGHAGRGDGPVVLSGSVDAPPSLLGEPYASMNADALIRRFAPELAQVEGEHPHMQYVASVIRSDALHDALAYLEVLSLPTEIDGSAVVGREIYQVRCAGCHGEGGRGDGAWATMLKGAAPADFTSDTLLLSRDYGAVFARIREGGQSLHGSSMPPWGILFNEGEIWDLVAYLSLFTEGTSQ
jgi:mono/diheme cytochrome c family protein